MGKLSEGVRSVAGKFQQRPPGLGPPGPNPLFFGVIAALVLGIVAGLIAGGEHEVVQSNAVYRLVVGAIVFVVFYGVVAALWLAWHRRTFKKVSVAGAGAEAPSQETAGEVSKRDEEIKDFMETTTEAIEELDARTDLEE